MIGFALCHGWAFDAHAMSPLAQALKQRLPDAAFASFDLGFSAAPHSPVLEPGLDWIAVGHSYGFAWLLQQDQLWKAAISLNGFTRFCRRPGRPQGTPPRVIDAMLARLKEDATGVVCDFRMRCGEEGAAVDNVQEEALVTHLTRLRDLDLALPTHPMLALATEQDLIVPTELSQACFADAALHLSEGDHLQLLREADATADAIVRFCRERSCTIA